MKILVTDDNQVVRRLIREELENGGYEVVEAASGEKAVHKYLLNDDFSLITMDINMEGMNGYNTVKKIRNYEMTKKREPVPIVFITTKDTLEGRFKGFNLGAKDFLVKPFIPGELLRNVDNVLKPNVSLEGINILLMEDNPMSRTIIKRAIFETGANVICAEDGKKGVDVITKLSDKIDMIISDFYMPTMDGVEVTKIIRKKLGLKDIPIIILTSEKDREKIIDFYKNGITDYILKPFLKEEFITRIKVHIEKSQYLKLVRKNLQEKENLITQSNALITELQAANDKLHEAQHDLVESEKQNAILATSIAANHEINQPLMVLQGNLELLHFSLEKSIDPKQEKFIERMQAAIHRIDNVLNKLKEASDKKYIKYAGNDDMVDLG